MGKIINGGLAGAPARAQSPKAQTLEVSNLAAKLESISNLNTDELKDLWRTKHRQAPPYPFTKDLMARSLCHALQEEMLGGLNPKLRRRLTVIALKGTVPARQLKIGSTILREYQGRVHEVVVVPDGFLWSGQTYASLSVIARKITGTSWNGPKFFGLGVASANKAQRHLTDSQSESEFALRTSSRSKAKSARKGSQDLSTASATYGRTGRGAGL